MCFLHLVRAPPGRTASPLPKGNAGGPFSEVDNGMRHIGFLTSVVAAAVLVGPPRVRGEENTNAAQATPAAPAAETKPAEARPADGKAADKPAAKPFTAGYKNGFWLQSEDESFKLRVGGYVQGDGRF